jgi:RNA polymerase sigma-70 factor (ECF subfamily)
MTNDTLEVLLDKLCRGDMEAAERVFLTYEPYLRKVVRRQFPAWLRTKLDSGDVVQSVWADLIHGFRESGWRFDDAAHLQAFLIKLVRHRFIDRLRQHRTAGARERPLPADDAEAPAARQPRPSEQAQADELWQRMLLLCPPEHRDILLLKRQGLSMADIVARTGLHEDSIRRILRTLSRRVAFLEQPVTPAPGGSA